MSSGITADASGPSLGLVLGGLTAIAIVLGALGAWRLSISERHFAETIVEMEALGPTVDTEGCVDAVLQWHARCEADLASCNHGVPRVLTHCLVGADRSETCAGLDLSSSKAQWVFQRCVDRGTGCRHRKDCPCASAYRAIDSFCRHDQKGIAL